MFKKIIEKITEKVTVFKKLKAKQEKVFALIKGIKQIKKMVKVTMSAKEVKEVKRLCNELIKGE